MKLYKKTAIITGGASGIGQGIALCFGEEGANVCIADVNIEGAENTAREINKMKNANAIAVKTDVSNSKDVANMVDICIKKFGSIDILVNNAGIKQKSKLIDTSEDLWNRVLSVNLTGVFLCCKAVLPYMIAQKKGNIINISSTVAKSGISESCAHTATKGAISALTRMLAWELSGENINVNAIAPGWVKVETVTLKIRGEGAMDKAKSLNPVGRLGTPRDIGYAAVFLASDEASYIDGAVLDVDGGWLSGKGF